MATTPSTTGIEPGTHRVQLLLAARGGARAALAEAAAAEAADVAERVGPAVRVLVLVGLDDDPFVGMNPRGRSPEVVLELQADAVGVDDLLGSLDGVVARLRPWVHADLSLALAGRPWFVVPAAPSPLRFLYLMRRKAGTTRAQYLDHYVHRHAEFGRRTTGIVGYTQFHVDPTASAGAALRLGVGGWAVDSVSELHIESLDTFFAASADNPVSVEAPADEELFVDRGNSVACCTTTRVVAPGR